MHKQSNSRRGSGGGGGKKQGDGDSNSGVVGSVAGQRQVVVEEENDSSPRVICHYGECGGGGYGELYGWGAVHPEQQQQQHHPQQHHYLVGGGGHLGGLVDSSPPPTGSQTLLIHTLHGGGSNNGGKFQSGWKWDTCKVSKFCYMYFEYHKHATICRSEPTQLSPRASIYRAGAGHLSHRRPTVPAIFTRFIDGCTPVTCQLWANCTVLWHMERFNYLEKVEYTCFLLGTFYWQFVLNHEGQLFVSSKAMCICT